MRKLNVRNLCLSGFRFLFQFILLGIIPSFGYCQTRNSFEIFYSPTFSKTNFNNLPFFENDWVYQLYSTKKPNKGIYGYYYGVYYRRQIFDKFRVGIGINYSLNGQQAPDFYKVKGISEQDLMNIPDYGGTSYSIIYKSYESPIVIEYKFSKKNKINYFATAGVCFNVYYRVEAENYFISKSTERKVRDVAMMCMLMPMVEL